MQVEPFRQAETFSRPSSKGNHLEIIDLLRGIAILLVLLEHVYGMNVHWVLPWVNRVRDFGAFGNQSGFVHLFYLGWAGVPLFFVLSGFCIHWSCLRLERFEIGRFLWQRFWRIYPTYLVALVVFSFVELRGQSPLVAMEQFWSHAFLVHNFSFSTFWSINGPFWSLAVEVQLYCLYPILRVIKQKWGWRGCFLVAGSVGLIWRLLALVIWRLPDHGVGPTMASPLNTWLDWTLGAWVADCYANGRRAFPVSKLLPFLTLFCFVVSTIFQLLIAFSFFLAALTAALWLDQLLHRPAAHVANSPRIVLVLRKGLIWFGLISYSFYLWHEPILTHFQKFAGKVIGGRQPGVIWESLAVILPVFLAMLVAYLSYRFLEKPGAQLGRVIFERFSRGSLKSAPAIGRGETISA